MFHFNHCAIGSVVNEHTAFIVIYKCNTSSVGEAAKSNVKVKEGVLDIIFPECLAGHQPRPQVIFGTVSFAYYS